MPAKKKPVSRIARLRLKAKAIAKKHRKVIASGVGVGVLLAAAVAVQQSCKMLDAIYEKELYDIAHARAVHTPKTKTKRLLTHTQAEIDADFREVLRKQKVVNKIHTSMSEPVDRLRKAVRAAKYSAVKRVAGA